MARRVHQVQLIHLPVFGFVVEPDGLRLDRDATFALDIHRVEDLLLHIAVRNVAAELDQPVGKCRFAVVDVCNDREIANFAEVGHGAVLSIGTLCAKGAYLALKAS